MKLFNKLAQLRARLMMRGNSLTQTKEETYLSLIEMWEMGRDPYFKRERRLR